MTRGPYLVGIAGPKHVGKSTVAQALCEPPLLLSGTQGFWRDRFADPIKRMLRALGLTEAQVDGDEKELPCDLLGGKTPRHAMQTLGTEWGRGCIDEDLWVRATMLRVESSLRDGLAVVVDDVRFDNEAQAILRRGGIVVKLARAGVEADASHASEVGIRGDLITYIVRNDTHPRDAAGQIAWLLLHGKH